jgi:hypothetical protein
MSSFNGLNFSINIAGFSIRAITLIIKTPRNDVNIILRYASAIKSDLITPDK